MIEYLKRLQNILSKFLGEPKNEVNSSGQLEFACPRCVEEKGEQERRKYNLSLSLKKQLFQCWSCSSGGDDEMRGPVIKLIKMYGNDEILNEYIGVIKEFRESKYYNLHFDEEDFNINTVVVRREELKLPPNYRKFVKDGRNYKRALDYLMDRGIDWDIIEEYNIGYTVYDENYKSLSSRIIIPSYNEYGELNYWTGRDFTNLPKRQKYFNPRVERKSIIFNENKIQWDCDVNLVEGPFDHIVVPNSIPLLGKVLLPTFSLYEKLMKKCKANVNIFLDGDAFEGAKTLYKTLNHNQLYNKIRIIPMEKNEDPSSIFQEHQRKGIIEHLKNAEKISEVLL